MNRDKLEFVDVKKRIESVLIFHKILFLNLKKLFFLKRSSIKNDYDG